MTWLAAVTMGLILIFTCGIPQTLQAQTGSQSPSQAKPTPPVPPKITMPTPPPASVLNPPAKKSGEIEDIEQEIKNNLEALKIVQDAIKKGGPTKQAQRDEESALIAKAKALQQKYANQLRKEQAERVRNYYQKIKDDAKKYDDLQEEQKKNQAKINDPNTSKEEKEKLRTRNKTIQDELNKLKLTKDLHDKFKENFRQYLDYYNKLIEYYNKLEEQKKASADQTDEQTYYASYGGEETATEESGMGCLTREMNGCTADDKCECEGKLSKCLVFPFPETTTTESDLKKFIEACKSCKELKNKQQSTSPPSIYAGTPNPSGSQATV